MIPCYEFGFFGYSIFFFFSLSFLTVCLFYLLLMTICTKFSMTYAFVL